MADAAVVLQEQVLHTLSTFEDATLKVLKSWTKTLATTTPSWGEYPLPKADVYYGFAEKLWANQKDFFVSLLEVATEAGKTVDETFKKTSEKAVSAVK